MIAPIPANRRLSVAQRWFLGLGGLMLVVLLIAARWTTPDPRGFGTHEQFGFLPPCEFRARTGLPCPSCGMTTSWSHLTRGHVQLAVAANPAGMLLGILAMFVGPWAMLSAIRGRMVGYEPTFWQASMVAIAVGTVSLIHWIIQLLA